MKHAPEGDATVKLHFKVPPPDFLMLCSKPLVTSREEEKVKSLRDRITVSLPENPR
jgi:hypothetical protein